MAYLPICMLLIWAFFPETYPQEVNRMPKEIEAFKLLSVSNLSNITNMNEILDNILIPRVVGSVGHKKVNKYIKQTLSSLGWQVDVDQFQDKTPNMGTLTFENIIATLNPNAKKFLILACHYDSKYFKNEEFLGATDSAVPCAMLINLANVMQEELKQTRSQNDVSVKLVFFDGEEAFLEWSATDSIYGARHLAARWQKEGFLEQIDMLVLLDLLGAPDPHFYSMFRNTEAWYSHICDIEQRFADAGLLEQYTFSSATVQRHQRPNTYFHPRSINTGIEDDHLPFLHRGVRILHLIPVPFPTEWHKITDNRDIIDMHTVENLNKILRVFVIEYLHISV